MPQAESSICGIVWRYTRAPLFRDLKGGVKPGPRSRDR